jgi:outer membrane protein assembly factor BamB
MTGILRERSGTLRAFLAVALVALTLLSSAALGDSEAAVVSGVAGEGVGLSHDGWFGRHGDKGRTGWNPTASDIVQPRLLWRYGVGERPDYVVAGDVSGDGRAEVFLGTETGMLYALAGPDGSLQKGVQLPGEDVRPYLVRTAEGVVPFVEFVPAPGTNRLCRLDPSDLTEEWCQDAPGLVGSAAPGDLPDGARGVFLGFADYATGDAGVLVFGESGDLRARFLTGWRPMPLALGDLDGREGDEIVATTPGKAVVLKVGTEGDPNPSLWTYENLGAAFTFAHVADLLGDAAPEVVVFTLSGFFPYAVSEVAVLDGATGTPFWVVKATEGGIGLALGDVDGDGKGEVVSRSLDGGLSVWDGRDGRELWNVSLEGPTSAPILVGSGEDGGADVLVATAEGIQALRGRDGSPLWTVPEGRNASFLAAADLDGDGRAEILALVEGDVLAIDQTPGPFPWSIVFAVTAAAIVAAALVLRGRLRTGRGSRGKGGSSGPKSRKGAFGSRRNHGGRAP